MTTELRDELALQIEVGLRQIAEEKKVIAGKLQQWAKLAAELKVGDVVVRDYYPYHGRKVRIVDVRGKLDWFNTPRVEYTAVLVRADGSDGEKRIEFYG